MQKSDVFWDIFMKHQNSPSALQSSINLEACSWTDIFQDCSQESVFNYTNLWY